MLIAGDKLKILAVDDNRTNLHILQVFLKKQGHDVITAENGEEAVKLFSEQSPDIVLLDIMMPIMNGFEAARRIKAMVPDRWVPVVFLSALNRDENLVEGLASGADDYLTKPINFVVLEAKLRTMQRSLSLQAQAFEALHRVETISDNVLDAIITIDVSGMIVAINKATTRVFGWTREELIGCNVNKLMPQPHRQEHDRYIAESQTGGVRRAIGQQRELEAVHKDGHVFPITLGVSETELDGQKMFIGVARDISDAKRAEAKLKEGARLLQAYYDQTQNEQQLALRLMEKQLHRPGLQDGKLRYRVLAAENFSGDAVAAARSPDGSRLYGMLADATGHGLSAAISVLPILAVFYRMTSSNRTLSEIVRELNLQLKESMPVGRFVAATLICIDEKRKSGEIWVGGTPEAYLIDCQGHCTQTFASDNLPLGILGDQELQATPVVFDCPPESQVLLYSDGVIEAADREEIQFGRQGLLTAIADTSPETRFTGIEGALAKHLGEKVASDDVSFMLIDCP